MEINLNIKKIEVPENTYDMLTLNYGNIETNFEKNVILIFQKFHDIVLGETKILLIKNSFPWAVCSGVALLNNSFFRKGDEKCEYSAQVFHSRYSNKANSYDFQEKKVIGKIYYEFTRKIYEEDEVCSNTGAGGFVQKMFGFFLSDEKAGIILNIKRLMDYINSGSHICRLNILFGGILVEKCIAEVYDKFNKNIDLVLEVDDGDLPRIFKATSNIRDTIVKNMNPCKGNTKAEHVFNSKTRCFRLKTCKIKDTSSFLGDEHDKEFISTQFTEILSSEGYRICNLKMLLRIKELFYFTVGSYANSWPSMFINSQKRVTKEVPSYRKAILEILGMENDDLLLVCLEPSEAVQYIVFYDKNDEQIVVSFKGTTNSEETIQDINCEYVKFCDGFVHNGFKRLSTLFIDKQIGHIEKFLEKLKTNKLLLVGHSLGGAIAILVKIMLKEMNLLKDAVIETVAFSAPPVVSENLAKRLKDGITTINYGNDIIPRMSYGSILDLKFLCCSIGERHGPLDFSEEVEQEIETILSYLKKADIYPKLYFPGELIHLKRIRCSLNENINPLVVFKTVDLKFFEQIVLIKHAPKHHMINHIAAVIDEGIDLFKQRVEKDNLSP